MAVNPKSTWVQRALRRGEYRHVMPEATDTLTGISAQYLGDPMDFRTIADANDLNPLEGLDINQILEVPLREAISRVEPIFSEMQELVRGNGILGQAVGKISEFLPPGYEHLTQDLLSEVNEVTGEFETVMDEILQRRATGYGGRARIVDWLLQ